MTWNPNIKRPWVSILDYVEVQIPNVDPQPIKLAVTYAVPLPEEGDEERLPVIIEMLPYRKDDSNKPLRYNVYSKFAEKGFVHAYFDIRGTGGSEGKRIPYEYSDLEIEDFIQVIQQLATKEWILPNGQKIISNGNIGLWGQSWSSFNSFLLAGKKARDPRLAPLKTIVPIHGATDFYLGDIHFMDGIHHEDEYIVSIDHENCIPSYGFNGLADPNVFKFDADFIQNRWNEEPWMWFYQTKQLNDGFWKDRTKFFWGPFDAQNPDDLTLPIFAIGSLLDGYRDGAVDIYKRLKAKGVPTKLAMGPSNHSLMDYASPGPTWDWQLEVSRWFYYWLVDSSDSSLINQNESAIYIREPGDDTNEVPGFWKNLDLINRPAPNKYYLGENHQLSADKIGTEAIHTNPYKPEVGIEMGVWWGENNASLGNMEDLDADALVYDLPISSDLEMVGIPEINLRVAVNSTENLENLLAQFHVRLEDVDPNGKGPGIKSVVHVTGASINASQRDPNSAPSLLNSGQYYDIKLKLHFSTWTFKAGHFARIAITNGLYRMMWPSPHKFNMDLKVNHEGSYVLLPLTAPSQKPSPKHQYAFEANSPYVEPEDGWYFYEGGYPRVDEVKLVTKDGITKKKVIWKADYYSNCSGWIIWVEVDHKFSQRVDEPSITRWKTYAMQKYQWVGVTDPKLWGHKGGYPSLNKPGPRVPAPTHEFIIESTNILKTDKDNIYGDLVRTAKRPDGTEIIAPVIKTFQTPRVFQ